MKVGKGCAGSGREEVGKSQDTLYECMGLSKDKYKTKKRKEKKPKSLTDPGQKG